MNLVLDINNFVFNYIYFNESVKNTVMDDCSFIRIIYSNEDLILNGIYIKIDINKDSAKNILNSNVNSINIKFIENLEKNILNKYNSNKIHTKIHSNKLKDQFLYLINKINNSSHTDISYILKISGIWETQSLIGLTFKFIYIHNYNYY